MTQYRLFLESGPKMKTTMVHVLDLLGCIANGPTTEAALEATPGEIRHFRRFLQRHGEDVDPDEEFTTVIVQHVMEGPWIGYGNPGPGFEPDFQPLTQEELPTHLNRLRWMRDELAAIADRLTADELRPAPEEKRPIHEILRHTSATEAEFVRVAGLGKPEGVKELIGAIESSTEGLGGNIAALWDILIARFEAITDEERTQVIKRGEWPYTARRGLRRALEHPWEHLREIERRVELKSITAGTSG
ncbi:MAG: DinB family protein [Dehalococcoidia bacterium]